MSPLGGQRILAVLEKVGVPAKALQASPKELGMPKVVITHAVKDVEDSLPQR